MNLRAATLGRLEESQRYSAFYRGSFANHLPMALVALDGMGAGDAQIAGFADRYARAHLEPLDPASEFASHVRELEGAFATRGRDNVLRESLQRLTPGAGSGAFHGLIRTAYALESGSDRELAHALAYWSAAFEPIQVPAAGGAPQTAAGIFGAVRAAEAATRPASGSIAARVAAGARHPQFTSWCRAIPAQADVEDLAPALIDVYARTGNFTLLHAVTGCHAVRLLAPFAPDGTALVRAFWAAVNAAYAGCGAPAGDEAASPLSAPAWPEVLSKACDCADEHDVKLVYSCWCEWQHRGGDLYRHVAAATAAAGVRVHAEPAP